MLVTTLLTLGALSIQPPVTTTDQPAIQAVSSSDFNNDPNALIDLYQFEVDPNGAPITAIFGSGRGLTRDAWGSSYATSTEIAWLYYIGKAKAAANIYQTQRIVQVCIWYSRGTALISPLKCSNASSDTGVWVAGPEVSIDAWDSLDPNALHTVFNIRVSRISPAII